MPMISIIVPVYNEENTIEKVVSSLESLPLDKEILLINDGSTDSTGDIVAKYNFKNGVKVINHQRNKGKGTALITGIRASLGDIIIFQDADLEYDPQEIPRIVKFMQSTGVSACYGTRLGYLLTSKFLYRSNYFANKFLTFLTNLFTGLNLTDMETGFKAFRRDALKGIELCEKGFGIEPEITIKLAKKGIQIEEVPISYAARSKKEGKKIRFSDGIKAIFCITRYGLWPNLETN